MHNEDSGNSSPAPGDSLAQAFRAHERYLWGLCYRMTGTAADAEEAVQDTFVRAMERPPPRTDLDWRPWLVRVAANICRDRLRRRKRRGYPGPWLPGALETGQDALGLAGLGMETTAREAAAPARYDLLESVRLAFLLALEELSPTQRAVLILRDVFDYSVRETARALELSEANVKTTLHRARKAMKRYDEASRPAPAELHQQTMAALTRFMTALGARDLARVEDLLRDDVVALSDGGGVYNAAGKPIAGRARVARMYIKLHEKYGALRQLEARVLNGVPAFVLRSVPRSARDAAVSVMTLDIDRDGRIATLYSIMAPDKLFGLSGVAEELANGNQGDG